MYAFYVKIVLLTYKAEVQYTKSKSKRILHLLHYIQAYLHTVGLTY